MLLKHCNEVQIQNCYSLVHRDSINLLAKCVKILLCLKLDTEDILKNQHDSAFCIISVLIDDTVWCVRPYWASVILCNIHFFKRLQPADFFFCLTAFFFSPLGWNAVIFDPAKCVKRSISSHFGAKKEITECSYSKGMLMMLQKCQSHSQVLKPFLQLMSRACFFFPSFSLTCPLCALHKLRENYNLYLIKHCVRRRELIKGLRQG